MPESSPSRCSACWSTTCWSPSNGTSPGGRPPSEHNRTNPRRPKESTMSITTQTRLEFRKLSARIGAEIRGLDLSSDLSDATIAQIREALNRHKALVFREANVRDDEA